MYPTYMHETKGFSQQNASKATMIAKTGAILGGTVSAPAATFDHLDDLLRALVFRVLFPVLWKKSCDYHRSIYRGMSDPPLDPPELLGYSYSWCILDSVYDSRCLGHHSYPS
jgi:hypothetical protein